MSYLLERLEYHLNRIDEISVGKWRSAAQKSLQDRAYDAMDAAYNSKNGEDATNNYHADRLKHAIDVAKLPKSKRSANSVIKAAKKGNRRVGHYDNYIPPKASRYE